MVVDLNLNRWYNINIGANVTKFSDDEFKKKKHRLQIEIQSYKSEIALIGCLRNRVTDGACNRMIEKLKVDLLKLERKLYEIKSRR